MTQESAPWPHPWPIEEHCFIHEQHEPLIPGDYRVCMECYHVFRTAEELIGETARRYAEIGAALAPVDAAEIYVCPLCTHDF